MQRRQENRDERDECPFRDDFVCDTGCILPIHRERRGPGEGQLHSLRRAEAVLVIACPLPLMRDVRVVNRVVGLETEYGALVHDAELSTEAWPARVKITFSDKRARALWTCIIAITKNHRATVGFC